MRKVCKTCKKNRLLKFFYQYPSGFYRVHCIDCSKSIRNQYNKNNSDKVRSYKLHQRYGLTLYEYNQLLNKQKGRCKICKSLHTGRKTSSHFHVDHCHTTGKIRGLLCHKCNSALGKFNDDVQILKNAIKYLKE